MKEHHNFPQTGFLVTAHDPMFLYWW